MGKQTTQKETIKFIRDEDFMDTPLTREERKEIRALHRECKAFLGDKQEVTKKIQEFEKILDDCCQSTRDYYTDVLEFLKDEEINMIKGYHKWTLSPTLWKFMQKIYDVKVGGVNY